MNKIAKNIWMFLIPILLLASILRLYRLDTVPPSPYWEETALGYDAYSIAETGRDHHGNAYPLIAFPSFGDYKPSGYFYAVVPFIKVLGLSVWSVRLPSAIAGIFSVLLVFLIGRKLFDAKIGLTASLLYAIQPWAIHFSRGGWEVNLALCFLLLGAWLVLLAKERVWTLFPAVLFFCLSMYTYHAARLFAPIVGGIGGVAILISWYLSSRPVRRQMERGGIVLRDDSGTSRMSRILMLTSMHWITLILSILLMCVFLLPLISNLTNKSVSSRFSDTTIFSNLQPIIDSNTAIELHGNTKTAKILYHRYWYFGKIILSQWASHLSPEFLFIRGDGNFRHGGWTSLLYTVESVLILMSLFVLLFSFRKRSTINYKLLSVFIWIGLAAVAPSLVTPAPHALRFLFASPAFSLLSAVGIVSSLSLLSNPMHRKVLAGVIIVVYLFSFARYYSLYLVTYPVRASSDWQYGYAQLYTWIGEHKRPGEQVYITREQGRPAMYYLFYSQYDPRELQKVEQTLPKDQLELLQVGDYHFVTALSDEYHGIIATSGTKIVVGGKIIENILDPEGRIVWVIWKR